MSTKVRLNHFYKDRGSPGQVIAVPTEEAEEIVARGGGKIIEPEVDATASATEPDTAKSGKQAPAKGGKQAPAKGGKKGEGTDEKPADERSKDPTGK